MLSFNPQKENCTACTACYSVCPMHCISMQKDEEGFLYPTASYEECISCGLCEEVCPSVQKGIDIKQTHHAYAAVSRRHDIWQRSTSGGLFSEICLAWGDDDTWFYGAAWNGFDVTHIGVKGVHNLKALCRSKYIESQIRDVIIDIEQKLQKKQKVIFCGTPCQVAGLRQYLRNDYKNLLLIDLICHGVGSPSVFKSCIEEMEKQSEKKISHYEFRAKRQVHETDYLSQLSFSDGNKQYIIEDPYLQLFLKQLCLRPSCGKNCQYRNGIRPGDITIADFKGLFNIFPHLLGEKKNYSTVISNTPKGEQAIEELRKNVKLLACSTDDILRFNPLFAKQTWFSDSRDQFFKEYVSNPLVSIQKWTKPYKKYSLSFRQNLFNRLPIFARKLILKLKNNG